MVGSTNVYAGVNAKCVCVKCVCVCVCGAGRDEGCRVNKPSGTGNRQRVQVEGGVCNQT